MSWFILVKLFSVLISPVHFGRLSEREKDLEILILKEATLRRPGDRND
jgi:hypothetical protein